MSMDLILKPACVRCGSTLDLYGSSCKHMTLCLHCGKSYAETLTPCYGCGKPFKKLIREYNVRANDVKYSIGKFTAGLPDFKTKNKWSLHKSKNRPNCLLEDETGLLEFQGQNEGPQTSAATYYLLMPRGKEFVAVPAGSWYNFTKVTQYKQLTLEEAEEKIKNRRKTADGYERWIMKAANNGNASDKVHEDDDEKAGMINRLGLKTSGDDDEEGMRGGDLDSDDDDIQKGDDWEHTEIFTDDDDDIDPEEREHLAPEIPPPPEIKQDGEEAEGKLSKSGKELEKLLGKTNDSDDDDDDSDDMEDDILPVKKEAAKEKLVETSGAGRGTPPASNNSKGKRKSNGDESKTLKKVKTENDVKSEPGSTSRNIAPPKNVTSSTQTPTGSTAPRTRLVSEEEIRQLFVQKKAVAMQDLVDKFGSRIRSAEDKVAFAATLKKIARNQRTNGANYVVLR